VRGSAAIVSTERERTEREVALHVPHRPLYAVPLAGGSSGAACLVPLQMAFSQLPPRLTVRTCRDRRTHAARPDVTRLLAVCPRFPTSPCMGQQAPPRPPYVAAPALSLAPGPKTAAAGALLREHERCEFLQLATARSTPSG